MRERLLIRLFLWRFLEHDLVSPHSDRHVVLSAIGGGIATLSLFVAVLIAWQYQLSAGMPPGIAAVFALSDRFLFTTSSMLVMALVAVLQWDALALDWRDSAVLGPLPLTQGSIVRAKFAATGLLAIAVLALWNLFPTLLRGAMIPTGLQLGVSDALKLTLAHGLVTGVAGLFGFLAVLGLRESLSAVFSPAGFRRVSAVVQTSLILVLTTCLLLLPRVNDVASAWRAQQPVPATALPPAWFVALHERLVGGVIDSVPRVRGARRLLREDREATELYRSLWPLYHQLAAIAIFAAALVAIWTSAACAWNNRRLPSVAPQPAPSNTIVRRGCRWIAIHLIVRRPVQQAGFFFTLQTLSRRISHRVTIAWAAAAGLALVVVVASGVQFAGDTASIPVALLAAQPLLIGILTFGFRRATRLPSERRAGSTFSVAWSGGTDAFISGVKRAGWFGIIAPGLVALGIWHTVVLGPGLAALHFGVGVAASSLAMELMFVHCRHVPFVNGDEPAADVKLRLIGFLVALVFLSVLLAHLERRSLGTVARYVLLVLFLAGLGAAIAVADRLTRRSPVTLDAEEEFLPTQRLNLAH